MVWSRCEEEQWRYWCLSIGYMCKSLDTFLSSKLTMISNKLIRSLFDSWVKFILEWYWLRSSRKNLRFSAPRVQIKNLSSIYWYHTNGRYSCVLRIFISNLSMKIQAYVDASLVPIAVPDICYLIIPLNSK